MNLKLIAPFLLFGLVTGHSSTTSLEEESTPCEEHNEKFDLFLACLTTNDFDYNVCRYFYEDMDWEEWTANNCYATLHIPRF